MNSKLNRKERAHIEMVRRLSCSVCDAPAPSDAHHIEQGLHFAVVALCKECHQGPVMGWHGQRLGPEDWKCMATAALKKQRVVPGIDGGFVVLGQPTSRMTVGEMADLITFLHAFGAERGVKFSPTSTGRGPDEE